MSKTNENDFHLEAKMDKIISGYQLKTGMVFELDFPQKETAEYKIVNIKRKYVVTLSLKDNKFYDISINTFIGKTCKRITKEKNIDFSILKEGDILVCTSNGIKFDIFYYISNKNSTKLIGKCPFTGCDYNINKSTVRKIISKGEVSLSKLKMY